MTKTLAVIAGAAIALASPAFAHQGDYADLAQRVSPAVVNIYTEQSVDNPLGAIPKNHPMREFFERFGMPGGPGLNKRNEPVEALGSGFIFGADGYVITNNHVVDGADSVQVKLSDEREYDARVVGTDERTDIALLKIEDPASLPYVTLGNSDSLRVGEEVMAVGNPFGLGGTVTTGIVSAKGRDIRVGGPYVDYIQTDASINRGNSGGPLFNMRGEVIGVNTAIFSRTGGSVGVGFAVPSNVVAPIVADLKEDGRVDRGWLGVRIQPVTDSIASALGLDGKRGALVAGVEPDGPAVGSLRSGDVILSFNDTEVKRSRDLPRIVGRAQPNSAVPMRVLRDGSEQTVMVTLGQLKTEGKARFQPASIERGVAADRLGATLSRGPEGGAVVSDLELNGAARKGGVEVGDVIVSVGGREVGGPSDVAAALDAVSGNAVLLKVRRGGADIYVGVTLPTT